MTLPRARWLRAHAASSSRACRSPAYAMQIFAMAQGGSTLTPEVEGRDRLNPYARRSARTATRRRQKHTHMALVLRYCLGGRCALLSAAILAATKPLHTGQA
jgi:hypothetical protein